MYGDVGTSIGLLTISVTHLDEHVEVFFPLLGVHLSEEVGQLSDHA